MSSVVGIRVANGPKLPGLERESVEIHIPDEIETLLVKTIQRWLAETGDTALDLQTYLMYINGQEVRIRHRSTPDNMPDFIDVFRALFISAGVNVPVPTEQKAVE